jgi:hypothetical protein
MMTFLFSYRSPADYQPRPDTRDAWSSFFEGMGTNLVDRGNPVFESTTLGTCESDTVRLGGYSLVTADDLDAAVAIAKACPFLSQGGGVEIGVITEIYRDKQRVQD